MPADSSPSSHNLLFNSVQDAFSALMFSELDFECQPWPSLSADAKHFVQHLLVKDPAKRATAIEALDHRYCQTFQRHDVWHASYGGSLQQAAMCFAITADNKACRVQGVFSHTDCQLVSNTQERLRSCSSQGYPPMAGSDGAYSKCMQK